MFSAVARSADDPNADNSTFNAPGYPGTTAPNGGNSTAQGRSADGNAGSRSIQNNTGNARSTTPAGTGSRSRSTVAS